MRSLAVRRIAVAAMTLACVVAPSGGSLAASAAVSIDTFRFVPAAVTVSLGDSVTWTNRDAAQHTATAPGVFDTGPLSQGQSRAIVMAAAGTFAYRCSIHPTMTGTVQVIGTATPAPPPPTAPPAPPAAAPTPVPTSAPVATVAATAPATAAPTPPSAPATAAPAATSAAPASPTPLAAQPAQASPAVTAAPATPAPSPAGGPGVPAGTLAGAVAVALAAAAAALALRRSRRPAA